MARGGWIFIAIALISGCSNQPAPPETKAQSETRLNETPRPKGKERLIIAFGDSLYAGYGLDKSQALPARLEARLRTTGINATVVNAGVSGDTSAAGRQRLSFVLDNQSRTPDLVIVGLGGNDALRQIAPQETRANMAAILDELQRRNIPIMVTGMRAPRNLGPDFAKAFEPIWPELAAKYRATLYPFILEGVITDPTLMQRDGVHPTANGIERMTDGIAQMTLVALQRKSQP